MKWLAILILGMMSACDKSPTILDGSSPEAFERTAEDARRDLSIGDRLIFDAALNAPPGNRFSTRDPGKLTREAYDGMTAADVVADARARGIE